MKVILLSITFFLCFQAIANHLNTIDFSYITKNNGLSDNNVECVYKCSDGFIWFGTRNGLCRFDGYELKIYRNNNETDISGNRILSIDGDTNGNLWIGTYIDGLNRFNKQTEEFEHFSIDKGIGERINCIKVLSNHNILVGSSIGLALLTNNGDSIQKCLLYNSSHISFIFKLPL